MISITHYKPDDIFRGLQPKPIAFNGSIGDYVAGEYYGTEKPFIVYRDEMAGPNDITADIDALVNGVEGNYYVAETAAEAFAVQLVVSLIISVAIIALTPTPELPTNVNRQQESPNNQLSNRSNQARPLQRVPDIKGQVLAVPDVVMPTYSVFEGNQEIEHGFYCVGRKQLQIEELKDGDTPIDLITGASAGIYYPFNSPNTGVADIQIGEEIQESVVMPFRSNNVDGLILGANNQETEFDATRYRFDDLDGATGAITGPRGQTILVSVGDNLVLDGVFVDDGTGPVDISGTYEVTSVFGVNLQIDISLATWGFAGNQLGTDGTIYPEDTPSFRWTDYFYMTRSEFNSGFVNVIAQNGMYKDNGTVRIETSVDFDVEVEAVDIDGNPSGSITTYSGTVTGADSSLKGTTLNFNFAAPSRFRARARRTTDIDTNFQGTVVDEIRLNDLYGVEEIGAVDFGNVTTIQTKTIATPLATAIKERQLNCIATEMLYEYQGSGVFASTLTANTRAVQSYISDAIDPVIGNRTIDEIEADDILALDSEIDTYFGITENGEMSYTFDSTKITFQDYTKIMFDAINCIAFREAGKISALFEKPQETPALLFTHRSKQPGSERVSRNFNPSTVNDGVEFNWIDPNTNTTETIYIPSDKSAVNPKKFDIPGVRNFKQATIRAKREYNKLQFNKESLELTVTAEGRYVRPQSMISVVKGTRVQTFDGEVLAQDGLELTLSQDVSFVPVDTYSITLKQDDGTIENIIVTAGSSADKVILSMAPAQTIRTDGTSRRTEFSFGNDAKKESEKWLAQEIDIRDKWFVGIKAINYTDDYYKDDLESLSAYSSAYSEAYS